MVLQVIPGPRDRVQQNSRQPGQDSSEPVQAASLEHEVVRALVDQHEQGVGCEGSDHVGHEQHDPPGLSMRPDGEDRLQRDERRNQEGAPRIPPKMPSDLGVPSQDLARPIGMRLAGRRPGKVDPCRGHRVVLNLDVLYASAMLQLLLANLFRRKVRTGLTVGSFAVALFLFGLLAIVRDAFHQGMHIAGADRLVVVNRGSIIQPLPLAYRDRLARIPGVTQVTFATWFGGLYRDVRHSFPQFAIDRETYRQMFPECIVPDEQWQSFLADREGAIVGEALAERFKWNVGDRVPIKGALFPG